jgi:hypothetical protein
MLAVITGIKPNDQLEAMLAAQMAAIHIAMMTFTQRLDAVENIPQQDSAERALNKLARTFTTQMETLKRYRTGGQQNVTVHHVSVSDGGQAIVGNVTRAANARRNVVLRGIHRPRYTACRDGGTLASRALRSGRARSPA